MRSRYTAFVAMDERYLLATWHPRTRPRSVPLDPATKWLGLKIVAAPPANEEEASVEFIARMRTGGGSATRLHERSRFVREGEYWYYVDGEMR
jgi:SEC-C motif domain protein